MQPRSLRDAYHWWQQICHGVHPRRRSQGWEQPQLADEAGIALNTVHRIARGEWVAARNLFQVCSVLDLRVAQTVDLTDPAQDFGKGSDPDRDRRLARPAATDRIATREEVLAGGAVIAALTHHHNLSEPRVDFDGELHVRSGSEGFTPLWRFTSVLRRRRLRRRGAQRRRDHRRPSAAVLSTWRNNRVERRGRRPMRGPRRPPHLTRKAAR